MLNRIAGMDRKIRSHVLNTSVNQIDNFDNQQTLRIMLKRVGAFFIPTLTACASIPEIPESVTSQPMEPISKAEWSVGMSADLVSKQSEERGDYEVIDILEVGALKAESRQNGNCTYVTDTD